MNSTFISAFISTLKLTPQVLVLVAFWSEAKAVQFKSPSQLPSEIQSLIRQSLTQRCPEVADVREDNTDMKREEFDQGKGDLIYTTLMQGHYSHDGIHPSGVRIWIRSIQYDIDNPSIPKFAIESWSSDAGSICQ